MRPETPITHNHTSDTGETVRTRTLTRRDRLPDLPADVKALLQRPAVPAIVLHQPASLIERMTSHTLNLLTRRAGITAIVLCAITAGIQIARLP